MDPIKDDIQGWGGDLDGGSAFIGQEWGGISA
jgi:hypothetical protein